MAGEENIPLLSQRNENGDYNYNRKRRRGFFIFKVFRYSFWFDNFLRIIGSICAVLHGASLPLLSLIFGQMTNTLLSQVLQREEFLTAKNMTNSSDTSRAFPSFTESMTVYSLNYVCISAGVLITSFLQTLCWEWSCEREIFKLRSDFFAHLLRQDIAWFDCKNEGAPTVNLTDGLERVREGIGCKCSMVIQNLSTFITGIIVGILVCAELTVVVLLFGMLLIVGTGALAMMSASSSEREQKKYLIAGQVASQVLNNICTVLSFGKEDFEAKRYEKALEEGRRLAMEKYFQLSVCVGAVFLLNFLGYALALWYGSGLAIQGQASAGTVFTVFFSVLMGAFALGNAMPLLSIVSTAAGAANILFEVIDRVPSIDPYSLDGLEPNRTEGNIEFKNVTFAYPARKDVQVLKFLNLKIRAGHKIGIVGPSGSGKSTVVSLLLRFYDPLEGKVCLDGIDISKINVHRLRSKIGVVTQEPTLFGTTIYENIALGHPGNVSLLDVVKAASIANAHSFISQLPNGYDTMLGDCGKIQLSGGEKQRIAIARALIRDPPILIFDEATSALDSANEEIVQKALNDASEGRTTIIIAHRLSSVRNADCIYVIEDGVVVEQGRHDILKDKGIYCKLLEGQRLATVSGESVSNTCENEPSREETLNICIPELSKSMEIETKSEKLHSSSTHMRLLKMNAPEWKSLSLGFLGCVFTAIIMPIFAVIYGEVFNIFKFRGIELAWRANFWSCMFVALAVWAGFSYVLQTIALTRANEYLVKRLRQNAFRNILNQPIHWLDQEDSSPSVLCTKLARDAPLVKSAGGMRLSYLVGAAVTLIAALAIAFIFGYKLALPLLLGFPVLIFGNYYLTYYGRRYERRDAHLMDMAGKIASESIQNIKTVQALGKESAFLEMYVDNLLLPLIEAKKGAMIFSVVYAGTQSFIYLMYAVAFWFGAYLVEIGEMDVASVFRVFFALAFSAQAIGQTTAYLQDYSRASRAAEQLFQLLDLPPLQDSGLYTKPKITGAVKFRDIYFEYPSRPTAPVLRGMNLEVKAGKTLAIVGASGSGKSTILALLQRFYNYRRGSIKIDGIEITAIDVQHLRRHIGLVGQEPVLFDCSLRDNIAYGSPDEIPMDDIIKAARAANIHEFIVSLPQGYDTPAVNAGQCQLSGGQKQRIAIARALVRNPCILLLDEATSALDATSEKEVQVALEEARQGRTCIMVSHRLSTVQNADEIAVLHNGQITEQGPHNYLMGKTNGIYRELVRLQQL